MAIVSERNGFPMLEVGAAASLRCQLPIDVAVTLSPVVISAAAAGLNQLAEERYRHSGVAFTCRETCLT